MTHGSLFSGIGGFDLAAEWMGWENIFHCEWNPFCQTILNYYWPNAASYSDIKQTDFTIYRGRIDVLTGGFPCQPFSMAGKRKGTDDDRYLWPEMLRAIREIQPKWIVGENVFGIVNWDGGLVFEQVCSDLEAEGYEIQPYVLPAAGVNAPHRRDRVWFIAHSSSGRLQGRANCEREKENEAERTDVLQSCGGFSSKWLSSNTTNSRTKSMQRERANGVHEPESTTDTEMPNEQRDRLCPSSAQRKAGGCDSEGHASNASSSGRAQFVPPGLAARPGHGSRLGYEKPNDWENFPTQSPVCDGDDGISAFLDGITFPKWRNESIKGGGNAVVPQIPFEIFKAIEAYGKTKANTSLST